MDSTQRYNTKQPTLSRRYANTIRFVKGTLPVGSSILDLGIRNPLSEILEQNGYLVQNTKGEDLDEYPQVASHQKTDAVCAFEIFEHLLNPLSVIKELNANRLYASVPLSLWFAKAYKHKTDTWDRHFHEFEDWQFDWLLEKGGWQVVRREKWASPIGITGIRPLLRLITPRYYIVEAHRKTQLNSSVF